MTSAIHAHTSYIHKLIHRNPLLSFREMFATITAIGLATHAAAFGLTMMMVPKKYALELNPLASGTGLIPYFLVTIAVWTAACYWIWRSDLMTKKQKLLMVTFIAGISTADFLIDFGTFVHMAS